MTESKWKPNNKLTRKQNAFVKYIVDNPKASGAAAAAHAYNTDRIVGRNISSENLSKPYIAAELAKYQTDAELVQIRLLNTSSKFSETGTREGASYAAVALATSQAILDRLLGKATQRIEQQSSSVNINIGLDI